MKTTDAKLDTIFSKLVRNKAEWRCERCDDGYAVHAENLHCSHFMGRRYRGTRWDFENAFAHCMKCHHYFSMNPVEFRRWALKAMGQEKFDRVRIKAETVTKLTDADKEGLYLTFKDMTKGRFSERT